jgi:hypothetical protein
MVKDLFERIQTTIRSFGENGLLQAFCFSKIRRDLGPRMQFEGKGNFELEFE